MFGGIDIGSRTIVLAALDGGEHVLSKVVDTGYTPRETAAGLVAGEKWDKMVATGYGRHAAGSGFAHEVITEIRAHALGARYYFPLACTVLDIGGQDTKTILLNQDGSVADFQMNEKCSAGTGKFLEIMAAALGYPIDGFGEAALRGDRGLKISSMCTVFAESEAVSLLHRGVPREDIARALHAAVAERAAGLLHRVGFRPPLVFSGGVARNRCLVHLLEEKMGCPVLVAPDPQVLGAVGAAMHGWNEISVGAS